MLERLKRIPRKHLVVLAIIDVVLVMASFLPVPIIAELIKAQFSAPGWISAALVLFYLCYLAFSALVSTWVLGVFYAVLSFLGIVK